MIRYYSTVAQIHRACQLLLDHEVYHPWGSMQNWYWDTIKNNEGDIIDKLAVYYDNNIPVAACALLKKRVYGEHNCGTWVNVNMRGQGIGKKLVNTIKNKGFKMHPWTGSTEARLFYAKCF